MNTQKTGIFLCDASYDKKDGSSIIGILEKKSKKTWQKVITATSPTDAEEQGLSYALSESLKMNLRNTIFICDNKEAISKRQSHISISESIQWLWMPREFLDQADFLSKVINQDTAKEVIKNKENIAKSKRNKQHSKHVNSIKVSNKTEDIYKIIKELNILLKDITFESMFLKLIQAGNLDIKAYNLCILEEIDSIEKDQKTLELGSLSRIGIDSLIDMIIFI